MDAVQKVGNGHPGTAFTFDGTTSAFMSDPACHPVWDWNFSGLTNPHPSTATVLSYHFDPGVSTPYNAVVTLTVKNDAGTNAMSVTMPLVQDK